MSERVNVHGYPWRPPEMGGRREQEWLNGEWVDHPLGHSRPYAYPFRTCGYCGSLHPDDLLGFLIGQGAAPAFDASKTVEERPGEDFGEAYLRYVAEQHDYKGGIRLNEADWKYGFPHKFYVEGIRNPLAGTTICSGGRGGPDPKDHAVGAAPEFTTAKFYTEHLADATDLPALAAQLEAQIPDIHFERDAEGKVVWRGHRGSGVR